MNQNKFASFNIELTTPDHIDKLLFKLSGLVRAQTTNVTYVIGDLGIPPHLTLHYMYLPEKQQSQLVSVFSKIAESATPPEIRLGAIQALPNGMLLIPCIKSESLKALHTQVVLSLEHVRQGSYDPDLKHELAKKNDTYRRNLEKYGYPYVMDNFEPHLSIARVIKTPLSALKEFAQKLNETWRPTVFRASALTVRTWGEDEQVGRVIYRYDVPSVQMP